MIGLMSKEFNSMYEELTALNEAYKIQQIQPVQQEFKIENGKLISFNNIYNKTAIEIPKEATSIGDKAFFGCRALKSIIIPSSITSIGAWAFQDCSSLESIEIPSSVTSIGSSAFSGCRSLTSIEIPDGVPSIDFCAFEYCKSLINIRIPSSVTSIGKYAFTNCSSLANIVIPDGVTSIENNAFDTCISLTSVVIPPSVTCIEDSAFFGCSSLTSIEISSNVIYIGSWAFNRCTCTIKISNTKEYCKDNFDKHWLAGFKGRLIYGIPKTLKVDKDDLNLKSAIYLNTNDADKICEDASDDLKQLIIYLIFALILNDKEKAQVIKNFILDTYYGDKVILTELINSILTDNLLVNQIVKIKNILV